MRHAAIQETHRAWYSIRDTAPLLHRDALRLKGRYRSPGVLLLEGQPQHSLWRRGAQSWCRCPVSLPIWPQVERGARNHSLVLGESHLVLREIRQIGEHVRGAYS